MTQDGLLIYNSEDSFIKMTGAGIEFRGGSGLAAFGQSINRESFTNDSQVAGTLGAPAIQPYTANPEDIGTSASPGNVADFARGNHVHALTNNAFSGLTISNGTWNSGFGSTPAALISGSWQSQTFSSLTPANISGSWQGQPFSGLTPAKISGSWQGQPFSGLTAAKISGSWQSQYLNTLTANIISGSWQSQ